MLNKKELETFTSTADLNDKRLSIIFKALGDLNRCRIFRLCANQKNSLCVSDIAEILNISVPAVSQHLKILEITGLLTRNKRGQRVYFEVVHTDPLVTSIIQSIQH